jgi:hypothetical protein
MRPGAIVALAASAVSLVLAAPGLSQPQTTNSPELVTIRVTVTDKAITMQPKIAARGSTAIFLFANHTTKAHTLVIGDTQRGAGKKIGFLTKIPPNGQQRVVMFLDYRGTLPYGSVNVPNKPAFRGFFKIV